MGTEVKVAALEVGGVEDFENTERVLDTDIVKINKANTVIADDFLSDFLERFGGKDVSSKPEYLGNGDVDKITFYSSGTQITANRVAQAQLSYSSGEPSTEVWTIYDTADGTTVLKTITYTYTFTGDDITKVATSVV